MATFPPVAHTVCANKQTKQQSESNDEEPREVHDEEKSRERGDYVCKGDPPSRPVLSLDSLLLRGTLPSVESQIHATNINVGGGRDCEVHPRFPFDCSTRRRAGHASVPLSRLRGEVPR